MRDLVNLDELYPLIKEVIENGGEFRLYPRGTSMEPMIHAGSDSIMLGAAKEINNGDVLFYKRENGDFVVHRLIQKRGDNYTMCGDNQNVLEYGIKREQILAKVTAYYSGEEYRTLTSDEYVKYTKERISRFPFYKKSEKLYSFLIKLKKAIKKG